MLTNFKVFAAASHSPVKPV